MKNNQSYTCFLVILSLLLVNTTISSIAQDSTSINNGYYISYPKKTTVRLYLSQKFAPITISSSKSNNELNYKTNSKLNLGAGVTYKSITLNLSYGFTFLNKDKGQGKTTGIDFQFHLYPYKWAVDLLTSFRKGYYLEPNNNNGLSLVNYYQRPDVKRDIIGFSIFRVHNAGRFSYRAALAQNDQQIKSAGSLLFGGEAYYGSIKGDSALVPNKVNNLFSQAGINKVNFFSVGPGVGYAYTLVIEKYFFITASATGHLDVNFSTEKTTGGNNKKTTIIPDAVYKGAIGFNNNNWSVTANILGNALYVASASSSKEYFLPTGNIRFTIAKKIGN